MLLYKPLTCAKHSRAPRHSPAAALLALEADDCLHTQGGEGMQLEPLLQTQYAAQGASNKCALNGLTNTGAVALQMLDGPSSPV
jgi:hypothetical protein